MSQLLENITKVAGSVVAVVIATNIFPLSASAVTTTFTDSATFLSNTSSTYLETFNSLSVSSNTLAFSNSGFSYSVTATNVLYSGTGNTGSRFLGENTATDTIAISFTSGNVTAVGGNFFLTDFLDNLIAGDITLTLNDGSVINLTSPTSTPTPFGGFTTDGAIITSLTIAGPTVADLNSKFRFDSFDNLYVGTASAATAVPEPFTILGTIFGAGYGVVLKRKLTKSQQDKTDIT
jgi:hypothetical protein